MVKCGKGFRLSHSPDGSLPYDLAARGLLFDRCRDCKSFVDARV
jgi:hypothetical protein